jgi:hypothetical protein
LPADGILGELPEIGARVNSRRRSGLVASTPRAIASCALHTHASDHNVGSSISSIKESWS